MEEAIPDRPNCFFDIEIGGQNDGETKTVKPSEDKGSVVDSQSENSHSDKEKKHRKNKKKAKKPKKKKKKQKLHESSSEDEAESKKEDGPSTVVVSKPQAKEIPNATSNKLSSKDNKVEDLSKKEGPREITRPTRIRYTSTGDKIKGRGTIRFHRSWSRDRSQTPPHWRQEQHRNMHMNADQEIHREKWTHANGNEGGGRMFRSHRDEMGRGDERSVRRNQCQRRDHPDRQVSDLREKCQSSHRQSSSINRQKGLQRDGDESDNNEELNQRNGRQSPIHSVDEKVDLRDRITKRRQSGYKSPQQPPRQRQGTKSSSEEGEIHSQCKNESKDHSLGGDESETEKLRGEALASRTKRMTADDKQKSERTVKLSKKSDSSSSEEQDEKKADDTSSSSEVETNRIVRLTMKVVEQNKKSGSKSPLEKYQSPIPSQQKQREKVKRSLSPKADKESVRCRRSQISKLPIRSKRSRSPISTKRHSVSKSVSPVRTKESRKFLPSRSRSPVKIRRSRSPVQTKKHSLSSLESPVHTKKIGASSNRKKVHEKSQSRSKDRKAILTSRSRSKDKRVIKKSRSRSKDKRVKKSKSKDRKAIQKSRSSSRDKRARQKSISKDRKAIQKSRSRSKDRKVIQKSRSRSKDRKVIQKSRSKSKDRKVIQKSRSSSRDNRVMHQAPSSSQSKHKKVAQRSRSGSIDARQRRKSSSSSRSRSQSKRDEAPSAKYGYKRRSTSGSSRSRSHSREKRIRYFGRWKSGGLDKRKLEEAVKVAHVKSESPPPTHWKPGQKPWKPKPNEVETGTNETALVHPVVPYLGGSTVAGDVMQTLTSPASEMQDLPSASPKTELKSDVIAAKIQYHLDDPNVTARPVKIIEKKPKLIRSRSSSSESSKSSSSSSAHSKSKGNENEERRKETKKFEERIKWEPPPEPDDLDKDDNIPLPPPQICADADETSRSSSPKTPPIPKISEVIEAASDLSRKKRLYWDNVEPLLKADSTKDGISVESSTMPGGSTSLLEKKDLSDENVSEITHLTSSPPVTVTEEAMSFVANAMPPLPLQDGRQPLEDGLPPFLQANDYYPPPLPPNTETEDFTEVQISSARSDDLMKSPNAFSKSSMSSTESSPLSGIKKVSVFDSGIVKGQIGVVKPMAIFPKVLNVDIPLPVEPKSAREEHKDTVSPEKISQPPANELKPSTSASRGDKTQRAKISKARSKSRCKDKRSKSLERKRSSPRNAKKQIGSRSPKRTIKLKSPLGRSKSPKRSRRKSSSSASPRRYSPVPPRRRSRSPRRQRSRSPRRQRSRSPRRQWSRSPRRQWSRSPRRQRSRSPRRQRSRSPRRQRSRSPRRQRSRSPRRHRSRSPRRQRSRSQGRTRLRKSPRRPIRSRSRNRQDRRKSKSPIKRKRRESSSSSSSSSSPSPRRRHKKPSPSSSDSSPSHSQRRHRNKKHKSASESSS